MTSLKQKIGDFRKGLLRVNDNEPLTVLSLIVIIFLDLFVLSVIFTGLHSHTDQLTSPEEYLPSTARAVFIENDWSGLDRLAQLQQLALVDYNNYSYTYKKLLDERRIAKMHPKARALFNDIQMIVDHRETMDLLIARREMTYELDRLERDFSKTKPMYDTRLLEKIGGDAPEAGRLTTLADRAQIRSSEYEDKHQELLQTDARLNRHPLVVKLWSTIAPGDADQRAAIIKDYKAFELRYRFVELIWQLLFLLPLFFIIYIWHGGSLKKQHRIQTLIASHLLVVAFIPILVKVLDVVVDLIPKYFFKRLFELLEQLHIIAIWHYLVILAAIAAALAAIYVIQKKIFNRENLIKKRLERNECHGCGRKFPTASPECCPYCGVTQRHPCEACAKETYIAGTHCIHCGKSRDN